MRVVRRQYSIFIGETAAFLVSGCLSFTAANAAGEQFDAEKVMNRMNEEQRYSYLAGVVEGLAVARYMKDGKQKQGMECIYDYFYEDKGSVDVIYAAFNKYPTYPPGSIVDVLVKQKCGE